MGRVPVESAKTIAKRLWQVDKDHLKYVGPVQLEEYVAEACAGYTKQQQSRIYWALDSILRDYARPKH